MFFARAVIMSLWALLVVFAPGSSAEEQRCSELGTACYCSEPLNTTSVVWSSGFGNPGDSTPATKECSAAGQGTAIYRAAQDMTATNESEVMNALPSGRSLSYAMRLPWGHTGGWFVGGYPIPSGKQRFAARWYLYHSPDMFSSDDCGGSKLAEIYQADDSTQHPSIVPGGGTQIYSFLNFTPAQDCCGGYDSPDQTTAAYWQGHWVRVEVVIARPNGQGAANPGQGPIEQIFLKDVTNNGPEIKVVDTSLTGKPLDPPTTHRTPNREFVGILSNNHRQSSTFQCKGFKAISHWMAAAWDRDEGQRIGPAHEIEGGGGDTTPPSPPIALRVQ